MSRPAFPKSILEFQEEFGTEAACWKYLFDSRWPGGFNCPRCNNGICWARKTRPVLECSLYGHQVSVTAGTIMHRTRMPLRQWFWAAYLIGWVPG